MLIALLIQLQHLQMLAKSLAARLELKHYIVLVIFAVTRRSKHHCVLKAKLPWLRSQRFQALSSHWEAELASSSEPHATSEAISTSLVFERRNLKDRVLQLEQPNTRPPRVSVLNHVSLVNPDLREFLTNKHKLELLHISPSYYEQVGCQLVTVHSVHCRLGPVPAIF